MAANLTPQQIAAILGGTAGQGWAYNPAGQNAGGSDTFASMGPQSYDQSFSYRDPQTGLFDTYGKDGQYLNTKGDAYKMTAADYLKFAAAVAGAGSLSSALGGGSWTGLGGAAAPGAAASGAPAIGNGAFLGEAPWVATPGATALDFGTAAAGGGGLGSLASSIASGAGAVNKALGGNLGGLLGAAAGALSSKDAQQTSTKDPWAPAQDFIKQQIAQGQDLSKQYQAQPFNAAQQTSYNNIGGLLNAMNTMAPTMMQGYANNASGANQFSLSNPRKSLLGSDVMNSGASWNPGLLNFFPQKG